MLTQVCKMKETYLIQKSSLDIFCVCEVFEKTKSALVLLRIILSGD